MKLFLRVLFGLIFVFMVTMTIRTSFEMSLGEGWPGIRSHPWAMATLYDAYFGFVTFFIRVAYRGRALWAKFVWFILIMGLGNIAMSLYVLIQLFRLKHDEPASSVLLRRAAK